jgi:hypothetical protein
MTDGWQYPSIALIAWLAWLNPSDILEILRPYYSVQGRASNLIPKPFSVSKVLLIPHGPWKNRDNTIVQELLQ